jgi:hypothetical protein
MNYANLKTLRDAIEKDNTFNMNRYVHTCGTPACIAGHATALMGEDAVQELFAAGVYFARNLAAYLDISQSAATEISAGFIEYSMVPVPRGEVHNDDNTFAPKKKEALAMLDYLSQEGDDNVSWAEVMRLKFGVTLYNWDD